MSVNTRPGLAPILLVAGLAGLATGRAASAQAPAPAPSSAPAEAAMSSEPAVAILSLGNAVEILAGTRATGGDPMRPPLFAWHASRSDAGSWGALRPLSPQAVGLPFPLRGSLWRFETAGFSRGESLHHRLLPLSGEFGLVGGRIEPLQDVVRTRVASVDEWTVMVVEQAAGGVILMRRITAEGPVLEMDVAEQFDWPTGWPDGTTLIDIDASVEQGFAWGRDPSSGRVHVATFPPGALPSLDLSPDALVAGALVREGPVVIALAAGRLQVHVLGSDGWHARDAVPWPMGRTATEAREIVARAAGSERDVLVVAVAESVKAGNDAPSLTVATRDAQGWSPPIRLAIAQEEPVLLPPLALPDDAPGGEPPGDLAHRAMLAGAALTSLVALAVMIGQLKALRRRRGERQQD